MKALRRIIGLKLYSLALAVEPGIAVALRQHVSEQVHARLAVQADLMKAQADSYVSHQWAALLTEHRRRLSKIVQSN